MATEPAPQGFRTLTPYLVVHDGAAAIEFYQRAFGAQLRGRVDGPDGKVGHASLQIGDSQLMLSDPFPQARYQPPPDLGGTSCGIYVYVEDVDAAFARAVDAGATALSEPQDMFWGDRWGSVMDPFGHIWELATHVEDVSEEDMAARAREAMAGMG
jgi:PhnB protein